MWSAGASLAQEEDQVNIANLALTLEYLQAAFSGEGLRRDLLQGRELEIVREIDEHHRAVIEIVRRVARDVLDTTPIEPPPFTFPAEFFADGAAFLRQAAEFAELGVRAYHGQITQLPDEQLLGYAAAIAGTKSRHAAILAVLSGRDPLPQPVEQTMSIEEGLAIARPYRGGEESQ